MVLGLCRPTGEAGPALCSPAPAGCQHLLLAHTPCPHCGDRTSMGNGEAVWVGMALRSRQNPEPLRAPSASGVAGSQPCPGLSVPVIHCYSSNIYHFARPRHFSSFSKIPLSGKVVFLFLLHAEGAKGRRNEKIHLIPTKSTCVSIGRGANFWMQERLMSAFPPPRCLSLS